MSLPNRAKSAGKWTGLLALFGAAAISPLSLSQAETGGDGSTASPVTVTATVTAHVAPGQCDPVPDGKLPQRAVDYASDGTPITQDPSPRPEPPEPIQAGPAAVEQMGGKETADKGSDTAPASDSQDDSKGPFDPYLCVVTPETPSAAPIASTTSEPTQLEYAPNLPAESPQLEGSPSVRTELPDLPAGSDPEAGPAVDFGTPTNRIPAPQNAPPGGAFPAPQNVVPGGAASAPQNVVPGGAAPKTPAPQNVVPGGASPASQNVVPGGAAPKTTPVIGGYPVIGAPRP